MGAVMSGHPEDRLVQQALDQQSKWITRAKGLVERALEEWNTDDPIPVLSEAIATLQVAFGELDPSELEAAEPKCICPAEMVKRGGYRGSCRAREHTGFVVAGGAE
jgi:hypothetical protein